MAKTSPVELTEEQRMLIQSVTDLAENEFKEDAFTWEGDVPWDNVQLLADRGYLGVSVDEEYGGGGMTPFEGMLVIEAIGRVCPDTAYFIGPHLSKIEHLSMFGTEVVQERYIPKLMEGTETLATGMSEPQAGSDIRSIETTLEKEDGECILNGEKIWTSCVPDSNAAYVWAQFPEGLGTVVVEFDRDGVEMSQEYKNTFGHPQMQWRMNDVRVPEENIVIEGKDAMKRMLIILNWERLSGANFANAVSGCALEMALDYADTRVQFDQKIGEFQGIEWKLAEMIKELEVSRALTYSAAKEAMSRGGVPTPLHSSIANLHAVEALDLIVDEAVQIHGANGVMQGHPLEYLHRLARTRRISGGTDEIQRNTIAKRLKKHGLPPIAGNPRDGPSMPE